MMSFFPATTLPTPPLSLSPLFLQSPPPSKEHSCDQGLSGGWFLEGILPQMKEDPVWEVSFRACTPAFIMKVMKEKMEPLGPPPPSFKIPFPLVVHQISKKIHAHTFAQEDEKNDGICPKRVRPPRNWGSLFLFFFLGVGKCLTTEANVAAAHLPPHRHPRSGREGGLFWQQTCLATSSPFKTTLPLFALSLFQVFFSP